MSNNAAIKTSQGPQGPTGAPGAGSAGGVNAQTISYLAIAGDAGKLISMNGSSLTLTLPAATPSTSWWISIENVNATSLTISRNSLNIDGAASDLTLTQNQGVIISTDGSNYFSSRGVGGTGGAANAGGVNAQTISYLALTGDSGKLISMNGSSLTLTLPAAPPAVTWWVAIENLAATVLTVSRNSLNIDGAASDLTVAQNYGLLIFTDGSNYFSCRGIRNATQLQSVAISASTPTNQQVLRYVAANTDWEPSNDITFLPSVSRRRASLICDGVNTTLQAHGDVITATAGAGFNAATSTHGAVVGINAGNGVAGGWSGSTFYRGDLNLSWLFFGYVERITNVTVWFGLTDQTMATMVAGLNPAGNYAAFRFDTSGVLTTWQCISKDGSTQEITDSTIAPIVLTAQRFGIVYNNGAGSVSFYINGVLRATHSTHIPSATTNLRFITGQQTSVNNTNAGVDFEYMLGETNA